MTPQPTNPLDRIRSLDPADMTDDELGVAVWLAAWARWVPHPADSAWPIAGGIEIGEVGSRRNVAAVGRGGGVVWWLRDDQVTVDPSRNPAVSLDVMMPLVCGFLYPAPPVVDGRVRRFFAELRYVSANGLECHLHELLLRATAREMAEAFVAVAREMEERSGRSRLKPAGGDGRGEDAGLNPRASIAAPPLEAGDVVE